MFRHLSLKGLAQGAAIVLTLLFLPVILIFLDVPAETLAGCSAYGYGCGQVACMGVEVSTDMGYTWRDGSVYIYGVPGSEKNIYVRTVLGVISGQVQGWSFGVRHDPAEVQMHGGDFTLNAATVGQLSTVQNGAPPDFESTQRRPCGYTQGVLIDTGSTGYKVSAPRLLVTSYACYHVVIPSTTGVYPVTLELTDDVGDPPIITTVTQNNQSKPVCKSNLTLNIYSTTYYYPTPSYCPLTQETPIECNEGMGGGGSVEVCETKNVDEAVVIDAVAEGVDWKYFKGTVHPSPGTNDWAISVFDDAAWLVGPSGFGYEDNDDNTILDDMQNNYMSVYARKKFNLNSAELWKFSALQISLDHDDGIRVFLNGGHVGSFKLPTFQQVQVLPHDYAADNHEAGWPSFVNFDLLTNTPFVLDGENILAVETHNTTIGSSDLSCIPELIGLKRGPFVAKGSPTQTTIAFSTRDNRIGRVSYGTNEGSLTLWVEETIATREHEITLEDLTPGDTYYYKVEAKLPGGTYDLFENDTLCFTTPEGTLDDQFTFAAFSDSGAQSEGQKDVADLIPDLDPQPEFFLMTGDVVQTNGERTEYVACVNKFYADTMAKSWFYQAPGNHDRHDLSQNDNLIPFGPNFNFLGGSFCRALVLPENDQEPVGQRELYYSFDWGPVHVVMLDTTDPPNDSGSWNVSAEQQRMRAWAIDDLTNSLALWKVVCFHQPPYTYENRNEANHIDDDERLRTQLGIFFELYNVDLVISGHEHHYERTFPLSYGADPEVPDQKEPDEEGGSTFTDPDAPVYIVTGGGGASLTDLLDAQSTPPDRETYFETFQAAAFKEHHLTTFTVQNLLEDNRIIINAFNQIGGDPLDTMTLVKTHRFRRGDSNDDGNVDISDAVKSLEFLFLGGSVKCRETVDVDDSGKLDITDGIYTLSFLFLGGNAPPAPYPDCGPDPTADDLGYCFQIDCYD